MLNGAGVGKSGEKSIVAYFSIDKKNYGDILSAKIRNISARMKYHGTTRL